MCPKEIKELLFPLTRKHKLKKTLGEQTIGLFMALSPNETFDPPRSGITPRLSYADAVNKNKKQFLPTTKRSLLEEQPPINADTSTDGGIQIIKSRVWRDKVRLD